MNPNPFDRYIDNLQSLADAIGETFRRPVTIEDANHRLIAYSSHNPQSDPVRIATIVSRRVPEAIIARLWQEGIIRRLMESDHPLIIGAIGDIGLGRRAAAAIKHNGETIGYIWLMEEGGEPFDDAALNLLKHAAEAAKRGLLRLRAQKRKTEEEHRDFFWRLLTGQFPSAEEIREQSAKLGIRLPSVFEVAVCEFSRELDEKTAGQIDYVLSTSQRERCFFHAVSGNLLIALLPGDSPAAGTAAGAEGRRTAGRQSGRRAAEFAAAFAAQLQERFGFSPEHCGCAAPQSDYLQVERSYREALAVLEIKRKFPAAISGRYYGDELGFYRLLPFLAKPKRECAWENRSLRRLRRYDREHHAQLTLTLKTFLEHDGNIKETADALRIHPNTLLYRLKRIAEVGGIDLDNMDEKVSLYLELKLDEYIGPTHDDSALGAD